MDTNRIETLKQRIRADINDAGEDVAPPPRRPVAEETTPHCEDRTTILTARYLLLGMVLGLLTALMLMHTQGDESSQPEQVDTTPMREVDALRPAVDDAIYGTLFKHEPNQVPLP